MSDDRNRSHFWRNVATGVGVAAAGAVFAYLLNDVLNSSEEPEHEERTVASAVVVSAAAFFIYKQYQEREQFYSRPRQPPRRRRNSSGTDGHCSELRVNIADKLNSGTYECNICLEEVTQQSQIFSCKSCYTIYHIHCLRQHVSLCREYGRTPDCPTCRSWISYNLQYRCFCGKEVNPKPCEGQTPHTCGSICGRGVCQLACHPGPCDK